MLGICTCENKIKDYIIVAFLENATIGFTTIQTVRSYSSTLVQARNLILSIYLHLILIYKIYECRHA